MKKVAALLIALGSGLAAFGFSGWRASTVLTLSEASGPDWRAGWTQGSRFEITLGAVLLVCGIMLRRNSK
jgi:hypothetical protein